MEYRERTASWEPDGTVELYMSHQRDYNSCLTRLRKAGVEPLQILELKPGYKILLAADQAKDFPQVIAPRRLHTLSDEERQARSERMHRIRHAA